MGATHAFAASATVVDVAVNNVQYKLALSGTQYDTDTWSDPEKIEPTLWTPISGLVIRPVGSPRMVWKGGSGIMSITGEIDPAPEGGHPYIALNPYDGKYEGPEYWKSWIMARNVFVCFSDTKGEPGPIGNKWDMDNVPTIVFKQVDP